MRLDTWKTNSFQKALILILICCSLFMVACDNTNSSILTKNEIINKTNQYLLEKYNVTNIYYDMNLINSYSINNRYTVDIFWTSSNESLINSQSGTINRSSEEQHCSLTATFVYSNIEDSITFNYTLPGNIYKNLSPSFNSSGRGIQIEPASIVYNSDGSLNIELYVFNNLTSKQTLRAIHEANITIYKAGLSQCLVKNYSYTNSTLYQFSCKYHDYVTITLTNIPAYKELDLARGTYKAIFSGIITYS